MTPIGPDSLRLLREMHERGESQAAIAKEFGVSQKTIWRALREHDLPGHPVGRRAGVYARQGGSPLRAARKAAGLSQRDVARAVGVGSDVLSRLEGIWGYRTSPGTAGRIASCVNDSREALFTTEPDFSAALHGQRTRSATVPNARYDGANSKAAVEAYSRHCAEQGLWTVPMAADNLLFSVRSLGRYLGKDLPVLDRRRFGPLEVVILDPRDVKSFGRDRLEAKDGRAHIHDDPLVVYGWARTRYGEKRARELVSRAADRRRRLAKIRVGTGRPQAAGRPLHHVDWAELFVALKAELDDQYAAYHLADDPPPTNTEIARLVAYADFLAHPERWEYDPQELPIEAGKRVWKAVREVVKPLQTAETETRAA
jgi:transcriptional regulator with XRE-family HTH domain